MYRHILPVGSEHLICDIIRLETQASDTRVSARQPAHFPAITHFTFKRTTKYSLKYFPAIQVDT